jgi:hypothetical protein
MTPDALEEIVQRRMKNTGESHDVAQAEILRVYAI